MVSWVETNHTLAVPAEAIIFRWVFNCSVPRMSAVVPIVCIPRKVEKLLVKSLRQCNEVRCKSFRAPNARNNARQARNTMSNPKQRAFSVFTPILLYEIRLIISRRVGRRLIR